MNKINNDKVLKWIEYAFPVLIVIISSIFAAYQKKVLILPILALGGLGGFIYVLIKNEFDWEKTIVIFFIIAIPFFTDIDIISRPGDFHMAARAYYRFNFMQIFAVIFLFFIFKNIKKIRKFKTNYDLALIGALLLMCFGSMLWAINPAATFYDALRYLIVAIYYVYFSRVFNYKKCNKALIISLITSLCIQLIIGCLQILNNGPIGLRLLGESKDVFRASVTGYEKGMSGTFGHPGPIALYSLIALSWIIFYNKIDKWVKLLGVAVATTIIVVAAGRTSIVLMVLIFLLYLITTLNIEDIKEKVRKITPKQYGIMFIGFVGVILLFSRQIMSLVNRFVGSDILHQFNSRSDFVEMAMYYIKQNPILGLGLNNYLDNTKIDFASQFGTGFVVSNPIHNAFLLFAVEIGVVGFLIYIAIIVSNLYYFRLLKKKAKSKNYMEYKGIIVSIIIVSIYNLQGWGALQNRTLILFFIGIGILYNIYYKEVLQNN